MSRRKHYTKTPVTDMLGFAIGYSCPEKGISIVRCEKSCADKIVAVHHYSHKPTSNSFLSLLVYYKGEVSGVLQIGYGIRPRIKGGYNPEQVREFDRMWLSDDMPKYSETIVLSLLHRFLRKVYPQIKLLISYADTTAGNEGTIYRAANYRMVGEIKADFYILPDGERVHPVTMWHRHGILHIHLVWNTANILKISVLANCFVTYRGYVNFMMTKLFQYGMKW